MMIAHMLRAPGRHHSRNVLHGSAAATGHAPPPGQQALLPAPHDRLGSFYFAAGFLRSGSVLAVVDAQNAAKRPLPDRSGRAQPSEVLSPSMRPLNGTHDRCAVVEELRTPTVPLATLAPPWQTPEGRAAIVARSGRGRWAGSWLRRLRAPHVHVATHRHACVEARAGTRACSATGDGPCCGVCTQARDAWPLRLVVSNLAYASAAARAATATATTTATSAGVATSATSTAEDMCAETPRCPHLAPRSRSQALQAGVLATQDMAAWCDACAFCAVSCGGRSCLAWPCTSSAMIPRASPCVPVHAGRRSLPCSTSACRLLAHLTCHLQ